MAITAEKRAIFERAVSKWELDRKSGGSVSLSVLSNAFSLMRSALADTRDDKENAFITAIKNAIDAFCRRCKSQS